MSNNGRSKSYWGTFFELFHFDCSTIGFHLFALAENVAFLSVYHLHSSRSDECKVVFIFIDLISFGLGTLIEILYGKCKFLIEIP